MKITRQNIEGVYLVEQEPYRDERGTFARQFCRRELDSAGIGFDIKQCNTSTNLKAGTLRGMHYQKEPYPEIKMVSCLAGAIYDVLVDLRRDSPTYLKWTVNQLCANDGKSVYIPAGVAHGFQTLKDNSTVYYQLGEFFMADFYDGVRWNDPAFGIIWPDCTERSMNERDKNYPDWMR